MGAAAVGSTISVYAVARLMMNLPAGILADRYGRKPLLVWGPAVTALGAPPGPAAPCLCARGRTEQLPCCALCCQARHCDSPTCGMYGQHLPDALHIGAVKLA